MFEAGAGKIGCYDSCCFEWEGRGQFRPLDGATPYLGKVNTVEHVRELRVEMVCDDHYLEAAVDALKQSHPYEEVAYDVIRCENF